MQISSTCRLLAALLLGSASAVRLAPGAAAATVSRAAGLRAGPVMAAVPASDAAERARLVIEQMDADVKAAELASAAGASMANIFSGPAVYPLAGVVGQEAIKTALLLCAVNPQIGGVVISGSRGTAKSVMARAVHELLPKIEVIKGSAFNIDKESGELDSFLQAKVASGEVDFDKLETEVVDAPFVQVSSTRPAGRTRALLLAGTVYTTLCSDNTSCLLFTPLSSQMFSYISHLGHWPPSLIFPHLTRFLSVPALSRSVPTIALISATACALAAPAARPYSAYTVFLSRSAPCCSASCP
jgi:hypothetical protein